MENDHFKQTEKTWDTIAHSFDATRKKTWYHVEKFINTLSGCRMIADLGCGNGRHLVLCTKHCHFAIGIDISKNLLHISKRNMIKKHLENVDFIHGNLCILPVKNSICNAVIYIAALHNIKARNNRIHSLKEVKRILKADGKALISVWSREQERFRNCFNDHQDGQGELGDIMVSWKQNNLVIPRFYHLYTKEEFINDLQQSGLIIEEIIDVKIQSSIYSDNYFAHVRKG
jgi:ubiquinone/menaquinone biosynthesis C-methylase UbiE